MIAVGTRLGPYEILSPLGEGAMGQVWRARDTRLAREVAIKALPAALAGDPEHLARFEREARMVAALDHPNIGAIHGVEEAEGTTFLVLALVEGETLSESLAGGPLPPLERRRHDRNGEAVRTPPRGGSRSALVPAPAAAAEKGPLDGKTFAGEMMEKGKTKGNQDTFVFKNGRFRSTACDAYGFTQTPYTAAVSDIATTFEAVATSPREGTMNWKGTVKGDSVEATAVWTKKGQADAIYTFKGAMTK